MILGTYPSRQSITLPSLLPNYVIIKWKFALNDSLCLELMGFFFRTHSLFYHPPISPLDKVNAFRQPTISTQTRVPIIGTIKEIKRTGNYSFSIYSGTRNGALGGKHSVLFDLLKRLWNRNKFWDFVHRVHVYKYTTVNENQYGGVGSVKIQLIKAKTWLTNRHVRI